MPPRHARVSEHHCPTSHSPRFRDLYWRNLGRKTTTVLPAILLNIKTVWRVAGAPGVEYDGGDVVCVSVERLHAGLGLVVPDLHQVVVRARQQVRLGGVRGGIQTWGYSKEAVWTLTCPRG
jgi:hypothetical protein